MTLAVEQRAALQHEVILASAGSGKTWQLTTRFVRLLADGVAPETVLATTFTRKAAGEILARLLERLLKASQDAGKLAELNAALKRPGPALGPSDCARLLAQAARGLARFQVRTLDSFFADLAGLFGLELGLPPGWSVVEEVDELALRAEAVGAALAGAPAAELAELLYALHGDRPRRTVHEALMQAVQEGYALWLDSEPGAWESALHLPGAEPGEMGALAGHLRALPATDAKLSAALERVAGKLVGGDWSGVLDERLVRCVLDGSQRFNRKPLDAAALDALGAVARHAGRVLGTRLRERGRAQGRLLATFAAHYQRLQRERRAYRFDDLPRALAEGELDLMQPGAAFRVGRRVDHLLLDEFQDTSVLQWRVLRPMADALLAQPASPQRSLLCVGDVKQAIYGWRDGESRLLQALYDTAESRNAKPRILKTSYRSSPVVLELVNAVCAGLTGNAVFEKHAVLGRAAAAWAKGFQEHASADAVADLAGCAQLIEVPLHGERPSKADRTGQLMIAAADRVRELVAAAPWASIAVLLRRRAPSARLLRELRQRGVLASGEGGNALTDSDAVRLALSLLQLADHPGDTAASFHLATSPLAAPLGLPPGRPPSDLAARVRAELHERGYGEWLAELETHVRLSAAFDEWERQRFRQLVELGLRWDVRPASRPSAFVRHVRLQHVEDPSSARVRVMTVHGAKGLEFDAVVLPDLDEPLIGRARQLVAVRDDPAGKITSVFPRPSAALCAALPELAGACEQADRRALEESLCVLYVALTRARRRLDVLVPADYSGARQQSFARLLRHALLGDDGFPPPGERGVLWEKRSQQEWHVRADKPMAAAAPPAAPPAAAPPPPLRWAPSGPRSRPRRSPSRLEGASRAAIAELLSLEGGAARARGVLVHRCLETIAWIEDLPADDAPLLAAATEVARRLGLSLADQRAHLAELRRWLARPATRAVFDRAETRRRLGLPAGDEAVLDVQRERRFVVPDEQGALLVGAMDRVVLATRAGAPLCAEIVDFKTDRLGGAAALDALAETYRAQMQAYRRALCALTGLAPERVACRLLLLDADVVREV
jgi:ATP-dependent exoDNAse (exonuclease V) beta subunit